MEMACADRRPVKLKEVTNHNTVIMLRHSIQPLLATL
jgi:hypothetical protein